MDLPSHAPAATSPGLIVEPPLSPGAPPPLSPSEALAAPAPPLSTPQPALVPDAPAVGVIAPDDDRSEHMPIYPAPVEAVVERIAEPPAQAQTAVAEATTRATIYVRLADGERVAAGIFDGEQSAEQQARELMAALDTGGDWPTHEGRYIRPDAVVSIDIEVERT